MNRQRFASWEAAWRRLAPRHDSITELFEHLNDCRSHTDHHKYYAPYINILQSSGTGKSHTMSRLSTETSAPGSRRTSLFYLCVRHDGETGFPEPDWNLRRFLSQDVDSSFAEAYHDWRERESKELIDDTDFTNSSQKEIELALQVKGEKPAGADTVNDAYSELYRFNLLAESKFTKLPSESGFPPALVCWWHLRAVCLLHAIFLFCE